MLKITFVKKILANGEPCPKCGDIERRLLDGGYMDRIDRTVIADERDPQSEGMLLATKHDVARAPFFIVEDADETRVYTVYFRFIKDELDTEISQSISDLQDAIRSNPNLDRV